MFYGASSKLTSLLVLFLAFELTIGAPLENGHSGGLAIRAPPKHSPPSSPERPSAPKRAKTMPNYPSNQPVSLDPNHGATKKQNPGATSYSNTYHAPEQLNGHQMNAAAQQGRQSLNSQHQGDQKPGNVAAVQMGDRLQVASSQTGVGSGSNAAMHPKLQGVVNGLESEGKFKGSNYGVPGKGQGLHAEMNAINNHVHQTGQLPNGGQSVAQNVKYQKAVPACLSCKPVLENFGINDLKAKPQRSQTMPIQGSSSRPRARSLNSRGLRALERALYARGLYLTTNY